MQVEAIRVNEIAADAIIEGLTYDCIFFLVAIFDDNMDVVPIYLDILFQAVEKDDVGIRFS